MATNTNGTSTKQGPTEWKLNFYVEWYMLEARDAADCQLMNAATQVAFCVAFDEQLKFTSLDCSWSRQQAWNRASSFIT
eukprot:SAG31_NODE_3081_length_4701_cov_2.801608_5_plen_79_part_00